VLNGSARKPAPELVAAVRNAAEELGYVTNAQAQALARSATGVIGLVVQDIADPYFSTVAADVHQVTMARGQQLMLAATRRDPVHELAAVDAFIAHRAEAIILIGSRWSTPEAVAASVRLNSKIARYIGNGGRVAVIGQTIPGASALVPSNHTSAAALANALVATGLKDFVVLSGPSGLTAASDRASGFIAALYKAGIQPRGVVAGDFTRDGGYAAAHQAINTLCLQTQPACLFAVNDVMALGASAALRDAGLQIPTDAQLAGFDDIPTLAITIQRSPPCASQCIPWASGSRNSLSTNTRPPCTVIVLVPGTVVLRESTRYDREHVAPPPKL